MSEQLNYGETFRRFVTGHKPNGQSTHIRKDVLRTEQIAGSPIKDPLKVVYTTNQTPVDNSSPFFDPMAKTIESIANPDGSVVRYADFLPHTAAVRMHRTHSLDYSVVIRGSIWHHTEDGDSVELNEGDILVQRGTAHAWENKTSTMTRMLFVLLAADPVEIDGRKLPESGFDAKEFEQSGNEGDPVWPTKTK